MDQDGNVLETVVWSGVLDRPEGSSTMQTYEFFGEWSIMAEPQQFDVEMTARIDYLNYLDEPASEERFLVDEFECTTVTNESASWSSVKSLYQ